MLLAGISTGCARWEPEASGPARLTRACPLKRAPAVTDYGEAGVYAMYHYVVQDASAEEIAAFKNERIAAGFAVAEIVINLNGKDTLFVRGATAMRRQAEVDREFAAACEAGSEDVYLTHVFYQPFDPNEANPTAIRVR
ncbi:conserved hypothetical protein [Altererythrobacter sp. B11]|nr:conserved hypothetical protein [Altererythrobacter sp. B11]